MIQVSLPMSLASQSLAFGAKKAKATGKGFRTPFYQDSTRVVGHDVEARVSAPSLLAVTFTDKKSGVRTKYLIGKHVLRGDNFPRYVGVIVNDGSALSKRSDKLPFDVFTALRKVFAISSKLGKGVQVVA